MFWRFISRDTFDLAVKDRDARIEELKRELEQERMQVKILHNQIAWRLSGVPIDPLLLPEQYRPKAIVAKETKIATDGEKPSLITGGPMAARASIKEIERKREEEFQASLGRSRQSHEIPPAQLEIARKLNETAEQAKSEAKGA